MSFRHVVALALAFAVAGVAGCERHKPFWLLMDPPIKETGHPDPNCPLRDWTPMLHLFFSISDCEKTRQELQVSLTRKDFQDMTSKVFKKPFTDNQNRDMQTLASRSVCVASDDPR